MTSDSRIHGTVKKVRPELHCAFLRADDTAIGEVYLNESRCRDVFDSLVPGDRVEFSTEPSLAKPGSLGRLLVRAAPSFLH